MPERMNRLYCRHGNQLRSARGSDFPAGPVRLGQEALIRPILELARSVNSYQEDRSLRANDSYPGSA